jgi:choline dehydrogenase-like flavoprotein
VSRRGEAAIVVSRAREERELATLPPGAPIPAAVAAPRYSVCFLDRGPRGRRWTERSEWVDCTPDTWTRVERRADGWWRRTWRLEPGSWPRYREQPACRFDHGSFPAEM